ncbi:DUF2867 domain-containing protein [Mycobacterium sp. AZCC_0083]|uniref:DUF2867 domain-containing protein n=1 Tax=Mycobacterium sp. AZCC_0083 TaxID=2735882 RepID=UPI00178D2428|nr:DUF2867 domain-containing protein [Mycobacterium sp. AZCC_0083]MBB5161030.1 hypothetical protein [Mycobacterium sp. AZCC_0083]
MTTDFRVEDVWALPTVGGPDDFPRLVALMESFDPAQASPVVAALFALRWRLGALFGLDRGETGLGARVPSLRDRLPADLPAGVDTNLPAESPFRPVYVTDDEAALEIANETMHGVLHLSWVPDGDGGYRGQMAVLVKPNGLLGRAYMAAIAPFRYALVYPLMLRTIGRLWRTAARQIPVPDDVRELGTLPRIDYADAFLVDISAHPDWTAERWAKAILEEAPAATRAQLLSGWLALGLKSAEPGPSILDWAVRSSAPDAVLLGRDSRIGMPAELLFTLRPEGLLFGTLVQHRTPATRAVWAAVLRTHVRTVLGLLERAASSDTTEWAGAG